VRAVVQALQLEGERATGHRLAITFNSSAGLKESMDAGEPFDVVIVTKEMMADLVKEGKVAAGTEVGIARSGIGVGIRQGTAKPDIRTPEAIKRTLLSAHAISYAQDGASRVHIVDMLERLGIAGEMKAKTIMEQGSIRSAARVTAGEADMVLTLVSEILPIEGVTLVGPLPAELQHYVELSAGVGAKARDKAAAKAFVSFLAGPTVVPTLKAKGMEKP
jgi:molybdate transport system substrate-binding protein